MLQVNIHEAKTQLSMLLEKVSQGEPFVIAKAGKPMAKVIPFSQTQTPPRRVGFLSGEINIPDDFDQMGQNEIAEMFGENP
ncbi:MAG: type II toxin-antitoxin system Phd/YefM family antitoxin [Defluviitaleaceae bacterium]|nr:type II toxin-antitoxin system Phd/YefM family antitoxin [Defluviitaleaceae bacterium]